MMNVNTSDILSEQLDDVSTNIAPTMINSGPNLHPYQN
jgi:hypothetical protein